jgi:hypothetical protein
MDFAAAFFIWELCFGFSVFSNDLVKVFGGVCGIDCFS